ncbi:hypothetical protein [Sphingomonas sp. Leaf4]|uniref:hypothetical protein n=1 Tax=Sphingomonas sp. Leaf4 TaxID=2876553 RepID=UPI001E447E02|nr:hypothetical protein [Sphingomonas sp. Leaf4]
MLHTAIYPAAQAEPDPDVEQAIADFRSVAREIRDCSDRIVRLPSGSAERVALEQRVFAATSLLDLRAERIGGAWTGQALLEVTQAAIDHDARRVPSPRVGSARERLDRVQQAVTRKAAATRRLAEAEAEFTAASAAVAVAELAAAYIAGRSARS